MPLAPTDVPFYPPRPAQGSNAIGKFKIGISQIGDINPFNWLNTVISQYANSPTILSIIETFAECVDQTKNLQSFYDLIFNVATAQGYGLDVWGRIVGVVRSLQISNAKYFGFTEGNTFSDYDTFTPGGVSPFYSGAALTTNYTLTDDVFRQLIFAKAAFNICDGSIPAINKLLMTLFGRSGQCYATDGQNMTMTYTFKFQPSVVQAAIISQSGVLPKPVGVAASIVISP